jgi:vacuolar iron transporter family protein
MTIRYTMAMTPRDLARDLAMHRSKELHGSRLGPVIHDIVYGAHDGIITTFAVVAGTVGADLSHGIIIVLGLANLLADGVSMGAGSFLSIKAERDQYRRLAREEGAEIEADPELERQEIREAFAAKGFKGKDLETAVSVITADKNVWVRTMMLEEHGMIGEEGARPLMHGAATLLGFVVFGGIPLLPYVVGVPESQRFTVAIASGFAALLAVGITRSYVTRERMVRGALEILAIGVVTASIAYGVGVALKGIAGVAL